MISSEGRTPINDLPAGWQASLNDIITEYIDDVFPACTIAVIHKGRWLLNESWGFVDPDTRQISVTPATLFDLASVSKLFTTTAFLSLLSQSSYHLDTPLVEVIPEFGAGGPRPIRGGQDPHSKAMLPTPDAYQGLEVDPTLVTFRQLLTHTSGMAPWRQVYLAAGPSPAPPGQVEGLSHQMRWAKGFKAICGYPFIDQPGQAVHYSDLGLMLLGEAAVRLHAGAENLADVIASLITQPLGLSTVMYNPTDHGYSLEQIVPTEDDPDWRKRRVWGEVHDENACGIGGIAGHAGLFATAMDVARFGQGWLQSPQTTFEILPDLARQAVQEQVDDQGTRRGLGWSIKARQNSAAGDLFNENAYGHLGFTGTSLWIDTQRSLVVACLTNRVYPGRERVGIHAFRRAVHDVIVRAVDAL